MSQPILPGATLGVLGGGQLGRMFVHAAQTMGYFTAVLDPDANSPAGRVSHHHVVTDYMDAPGLGQLAESCDAITTEFENVPAPALARLAVYTTVSPAAASVAIAQDRAQEKAHFVACGVPCAPYAVIETAAQLAAVTDELLPGILKTARMGYDGKGQVRVASYAELAQAWLDLKGVPCVLEKMLPLAAECSVIVARGADGQMVNLPVQRNLHRDGILAVTEVHEGNMPAAQEKQALAAAKSIASGLDYVGVLCVEFFVLEDGSLVVNEIAPRPHNSGHASMDCCDVSQFELQVRTLTGLPLVQPRQHSPALMLNLLGDLWFVRSEKAATPPWAQVLALPGAHLHLYGKSDAKRGRKMGHLTFTGPSVDAVRATALQAAELLGIEAFLSMLLDGRDPAAVQQAAQALAAGDLLGLPTETVYGLAADASNDAAVAKIFAAKGRPSDHPLIVHIAPEGTGVAHFASQVPAFAQQLMDAFWPGPLTLILPRRPGVGAAAAGGQDSIGLRCPSHPVAQAVFRAAAALGVDGVAAPSANKFGRVSPTTAAHVQSEFEDGLLVLDGGPCTMGIESTIVDCTRGVPVLLRPGSISRDQIEQACGQALRSKEELEAPNPRASGTLEAHYAPSAKVRLMDTKVLQTALDLLGQVQDGVPGSIGVYARSPLHNRSRQALLRSMPEDAAAAAQELFAALRNFDTQGVRLIWIETPPDSPEWEGVRDRLQRAAAA